MKTGKISEPILKRSVLKKISYKDKSVLGRAAVGYDAAVVALDDYKLVTSTQTVVDKRDLHMNRAFIKAVNNLAAMGVEPKYAQISIVLPDDSAKLSLEKDQDLCTLITCTPYGINSHRLLVRGHRVENLKEKAHVSADGMQINTRLVALTIAAPSVAILFIAALAFKRRR